MNQRAVLLSALAGVIASGLLVSTAVSAAEPATGKSKEKCYGVVKAGQNDCANLSGSHSCAGQSTVDSAVDEWKFVAKGTCQQLGGKLAAEVKIKSGSTP
jgi:uncharacterized membrane protein